MNRRPDGPLSIEQRNAMLADWLREYPRPVALLTAKRPGLVRRCYAAGLSEDDVNAACLYGAVLSARLYDPKRGTKFSSYVCNFLPLHAARELKTLTARDGRRLGGRVVRSAGDDGEPLDEVAVDADDGGGGEGTEAVLAVRRAVASLPERERRAAVLRFGLDGSEPLTQAEVGERLGLSRSWFGLACRRESVIGRALARELGRAG